MPLRALFFDFDGVIADTENLHIVAWQRTLAALGWELGEEHCARAAEVDDRDFLKDLFRDRRIDGGDIDGWVRIKQELTLRLLADAPRVYPGVADLIAVVRGRFRLAVVSTSWRANIQAVLKGAGLADAFESIVAKEDIRRAKPDPECYLLALSRFGIGPEEAIALEDSPSGLKAARGAGLRVLAVGHRLGKGKWSGDAPYAADLTRTTRLIQMLEDVAPT